MKLRINRGRFNELNKQLELARLYAEKWTTRCIVEGPRVRWVRVLRTDTKEAGG